jgi:DNA-binding beta-propeller fold protein YncE
MTMNSRFATYLILACCVLGFAVPAVAQWTDGQDATYVIGQPDFTTNTGTTTQNGLNQGIGVALDLTNSKLYIADGANNRVLRFAYPITGNQPNAEAVLGQANYTSGAMNRGGSVAANTMAGPRSVAVDSAGRLWVADSVNNRVLRFDSAHTKTNGDNADGVLGQEDFVSSGTNTDQDGVNGPWGVAVDAAAGRLWVGDGSNSRVLRFDNASAKANGDDADGVLGQEDYVSSGTNTDQDGMNVPHGVEIDTSGRLWVADSDNSRVLRFDNAAAKANGADADGVLGQEDYVSDVDNTDADGMTGPYDVALDNAGRLYVADLYNNRVMLFDNAAAKANGDDADNVLGQEDLVSSGSVVDQDGMGFPVSLCVDSTNNRLFLGDYAFNRVTQFNASGTLPVEISSFGIE